MHRVRDPRRGAAQAFARRPRVDGHPRRRRCGGAHATDITEYRVFLFGFALILMMIFRPQGLLPSRQRAAELADAGSDAASLGAAAPPPDDADAPAAEALGASTPAVPTDVDLP